MKKHWLVTLGVYSLGVATIPAILVGARWWQAAERTTTPKFIDVRNVGVKADGDLINDTAALDEPAPAFTADPQPQPLDPFADEAPLEFNSAAQVRKKQPVRVNFESEVEPPVRLAQKSPTRKQPLSINLDVEFEPQPALRPEVLDEADLPSSPSTPEVVKAELPDGIESLADADVTEEQKAKLGTLREKLAELTKAKAELINEQTLTETITALEKQISDLHAAQKLLSAQQILKALAEEFPDSPAAAKAKRMLEAAESRKAPNSSRDKSDGFERRS